VRRRRLRRRRQLEVLAVRQRLLGCGRLGLHAVHVVPGWLSAFNRGHGHLRRCLQPVRRGLLRGRRRERVLAVRARLLFIRARLRVLPAMGDLRGRKRRLGDAARLGDDRPLLHALRCWLDGPRRPFDKLHRLCGGLLQQHRGRLDVHGVQRVRRRLRSGVGLHEHARHDVLYVRPGLGRRRLELCLHGLPARHELFPRRRCGVHAV
jgi:hypothetical protein